MQTAEKKTGKGSFLSNLLHQQIIIPLAALLLLFLFNLIVDPSFLPWVITAQAIRYCPAS